MTNRNDLKRVKKSSVKVIFGNNYSKYKDGLQKLNLKSLNERRDEICLKFAKKCLTNERMKNIFPKNVKKHKMILRKQKKYKTSEIKTKRYKKSAIPYMIELLNKNANEKKSKYLKTCPNI